MQSQIYDARRAKPRSSVLPSQKSSRQFPTRSRNPQLTVERGRSMNHAMRATLLILVALVSIATLLSATAQAQTRTNNTAGCSGNTVNYNPANGEDIVVPLGFKVERFSKQDLNFPTGIAFIGNKNDFKVLVLESGHGLPSRCNENENPVFGGKFSASNPMTPDIVILDKNGNKISGPIAKPTP